MTSIATPATAFARPDHRAGAPLEVADSQAPPARPGLSENRLLRGGLGLAIAGLLAADVAAVLRAPGADDLRSRASSATPAVAPAASSTAPSTDATSAFDAAIRAAFAGTSAAGTTAAAAAVPVAMADVPAVSFTVPAVRTVPGSSVSPTDGGPDSLSGGGRLPIDLPQVPAPSGLVEGLPVVGPLLAPAVAPLEELVAAPLADVAGVVESAPVADVPAAGVTDGVAPGMGAGDGATAVVSGAVGRVVP